MIARTRKVAVPESAYPTLESLLIAVRDCRACDDESRIAIVPMGYCYPGRGDGGDLPPRRECAALARSVAGPAAAGRIEALSRC